MGGGSELEDIDPKSTIIEEDIKVEFPTASDMVDADMTPAAIDTDDDGRLVRMVDPGGGRIERRRRESALRVAGAAAVSLVGVVPWAVALGVESLVRKGTNGNDQFAVEQVGWSFVSGVYGDVANLSSVRSAYATMRWSFPETLSMDVSSSPGAAAAAAAAAAAVVEDCASLNPLAGTEEDGGGGGGGAEKDGPTENKAKDSLFAAEEDENEPDGVGGDGEHDATGLVALTIDDAPGDNPEAFARLLDVLKEFGAKASFFCTSDLLEACAGAMKPLMERALREGHELCNHCPADRAYHLDSQAKFSAELEKASDAMQPFLEQQEARAHEHRAQAEQKRRGEAAASAAAAGGGGGGMPPLSASSVMGNSWVDVTNHSNESAGEGVSGAAPAAPLAEEEEPVAESADSNGEGLSFLSTTRKRWKWFRPPMGMMSNAMASVLADQGFSCVLGDVFSNDVFVGGSHKGVTAGPSTVHYHVDYCVKRTRAGSVVIFHVPQARERLMSVEVVRGYLEALRDNGVQGGARRRLGSRSESAGRRSSMPSSARGLRESFSAAWKFQSSGLDSDCQQPPLGCAAVTRTTKLRCVTLSELANAVESAPLHQTAL